MFIYVYLSHVIYYEHDSHPVPSPKVRYAAYDKMTVGPENSQQAEK